MIKILFNYRSSIITTLQELYTFLQENMAVLPFSIFLQFY